jgi:hypothetical protein
MACSRGMACPSARPPRRPGRPGRGRRAPAGRPRRGRRAREGAAERVVLLDWGRARVGSPLEDVASWLQSLGFWEPEARRRHDTLLRRYLVARGLPRHLGPEVRDAYWLAAASNGLAGALRYHLAVIDGWSQPTAARRAHSVRAAADWLRVIRRADAYWRGAPSVRRRGGAGREAGPPVAERALLAQVAAVVEPS